MEALRELGRLLCRAAGQWNGYCTRECTSRACPSASTCYPFTSGKRQCLEDCTGAGSAENSCRRGYVCLTFTPQGGGSSTNYCYPGCDVTGCDVNETCGADGYCR